MTKAVDRPVEPGQSVVGKARMAHARPARARTEADKAALAAYGRNRRPPRMADEPPGVCVAATSGRCAVRRHVVQEGEPIVLVAGTGWSCVQDAEGRL